MHLIGLKHSGLSRDSLRNGIADLKGMTNAHCFKGDSLDILRFLSGHWGIDGVEDLFNVIMMMRVLTVTGKEIIKILLDHRPRVRIIFARMLRGCLGRMIILLLAFPFQGSPLLEFTPSGSLEKAGFRIVEDSEGRLDKEEEWT